VAFSIARAGARANFARAAWIYGPPAARAPSSGTAAADSTRFLGDSRGSDGIEDKTGLGWRANARYQAERADS